MVAFSSALTRAAAIGGGPKALADALAGALDAAVLVEDAEWRHVALANRAARTLPTSVRDAIAGRDDDGEGIALELPGVGWIRSFAIRAGDAPFGWLTLFPVAALPAHAAPFARLCANAVAVELAREGGGGRNRRRAFWDRLLARGYDDAGEMREDAAARGVALAPGYVALSIEAEGLDEAVATAKTAELRKACTEILGGRGGEIVTLERGGGFVFLVPCAIEVDAANARTAAEMIPRALAKAKSDLRVVGGVGTYATAFEAARTVEDAREALAIARRLFGAGRIAAHEDLGFYPMLVRGGVDRETLVAFAKRALEPLRAYDEKHQTELVRTLRLFFDVGQNIKVAAAELSVHRHTIFYRLRQIGEIGGYDLDSPHDQLTLRTAMAIDALHG